MDSSYQVKSSGQKMLAVNRAVVANFDGSGIELVPLISRDHDAGPVSHYVSSLQACKQGKISSRSRPGDKFLNSASHRGPLLRCIDNSHNSSSRASFRQSKQL